MKFSLNGKKKIKMKKFNIIRPGTVLNNIENNGFDEVRINQNKTNQSISFNEKPGTI